MTQSEVDRLLKLLADMREEHIRTNVYLEALNNRLEFLITQQQEQSYATSRGKS